VIAAHPPASTQFHGAFVKRVAALLALAALSLGPAQAADDAAIARLALCQDSWADWSKSAPERLNALGAHFRATFTQKEGDAFFVPLKPTTIAGLRIVQAFPGSVGMGVGFSLIVETDFATARKVMEKTLGKTLGKCEASDGMHSCEFGFAPQRTFTLMAEDGTKNRTLIGCYYYYEK
jgi:hypothetical protein